MSSTQARLFRGANMKRVIGEVLMNLLSMAERGLLRKPRSNKLKCNCKGFAHFWCQSIRVFGGCGLVIGGALACSLIITLCSKKHIR